jgi:hypothetical protein
MGLEMVKKGNSSRAWRCMPVIPTLGRLGKEDYGLKATLNLETLSPR